MQPQTTSISFFFFSLLSGPFPSFPVPSPCFSWQWIATRSCCPSLASVMNRAWPWRPRALALPLAAPSPPPLPLAVPAQPSSTQPTHWSRYLLIYYCALDQAVDTLRLTSPLTHCCDLFCFYFVSRRSLCPVWWWLWCVMCLRCFTSWLTLMNPGKCKPCLEWQRRAVYLWVVQWHHSSFHCEAISLYIKTLL